MTPATYRVVTRGLQPDTPAALAADQLVLLFKCGKDQIAPLLADRRFTVRKGLDHAAAEKYAKALGRCGCVCTVEEDVPPAAPRPPVQAAPLTQAQTLSVVPVLRRAAARSTEADPIVVQPFVADLEIVFRTVPDDTLVRQAALQASMMTVDGLYELAVWNLYRQLQPRMMFKQMGSGQHGNGGGGGGASLFSYVETGIGLEAACLLLAPVWQSVAGHVKGPVRIMVPNAHSCFFCGADDPVAFAMMSDIGGETWSDAGAAALSPYTYEIDAAGRVTVVPGAYLQRGAPPPPAASSPRSAQLPIPTLHAEAGNAALLALSDARLRQLQPQLFDPAHWPKEAARMAWIDNIRTTLARGDSRAAVVIDAAAGVVASYTDELDCVVMLKFDPALGQAHGWQDGTRLLSANSYFGRDGGIAPDLQPGPGDAGRWGNVFPLIADLLTDDRDRLAARKREIDDAEWTRALELGRRAHAGHGTARDGRPLTAAQPVAVRAAPGPAAASAQAPAGRTHARLRRRTRPAGSFGGCVKNVGLASLCAGAVWAAGPHVAGMPHDGLFYAACFGIAMFGFIGLSCLWSATGYLRGA